jgi:hypothetical protein
MMTIKKCFLYLITPLLLCSYVQAAATLSVGDFTGSPGPNATEVLIKFQNDEAIALLSFDLKYKAVGANVQLDGDVELLATGGSVLVNPDSVTAGATVNVVEKDTETLTFTINNFAGAAINPSATAQTIFTVKLLVGVGAAKEETPLELIVDSVTATNFQAVDTDVNNGTFAVVYKFNAPALADEALEDAVEQVVLTPVFTNEEGVAVDGVINLVEFDGDAATLGAFAISADQKSILYTAPTKVGNIDPFDIVAKYTASSGDNVDKNTVTITVTPVNDPAEIAIVEPIAAINETEKLVFTIIVDDEEEGEFDYVVYVQIGNLNWEEVEGEWDGLTFTSAKAPGYDAVGHPNLTSVYNIKVKAIDKFDEQEAESAPAEVTIHDVDQPVGPPTDLVITPDPAYTTSELKVNFTAAVDPDEEDVVGYTYEWTNDKNDTTVLTETVPAGTAKKGETWTVVVTANSFNNDKKASDPAEITISNSLPTVGDGTLFVRKGEGLPKSKDIDLSKLAQDADGQGDIVGMEIVTQPTKGTLVLKEGTTYTYTVDGDDEFFGDDADFFTFKAIDADGGKSEDAATVAVTYRTNPPPVFVADTAQGVDAAGYDEVDVDNDNAPAVVNVSVDVGDTEVAEGIEDTGVAKVVWKLERKDGGALPDGVTLDYIEAPGIEKETGTVACTITFPSFDTVAGADRPAELIFVLSVVATDGDEAESEPFAFPDIVIRDVDRAPEAATGIVFDTPREDNRLFTDYDAKAKAEGAQDPDGDALVGYRYTWTLANDKLPRPLSLLEATPDMVEDGGADFCNWPFARKLIKGDRLSVKAVAVTAPAYNAAARLESPTFTSDELTVENTAPYFETEAGVNWELFESATGTEEAVLPLAFEWENIDRNLVLIANDIDAAAFQIDDNGDKHFVDSLVFSIDENAEGADYDAAAGPVVIGADGKSVVYTPAKHYNGQFKVGVKVTDEDGASATYLLTVTVEAVNDPPVVAVSDIYAVPNDCDGVTVHIKYFAVYPGGTDATEAAQLLLKAQTLADDPNDIILYMEAVVINGFDEEGHITDGTFADADVKGDPERGAALAKFFATTQRAVAVKYILAEDAPMGEEIPLELLVQDDGGSREGMDDDKSLTPFKLVLGATPWYPIYDLPCAEHETHQVTLAAPGEETVIVYVAGPTLKPEHYFYSNTNGLTSGVVYTAELRPWNPAQGVAGDVCEADEDDLQVQVPEYDVPGQAEVAIGGPAAIGGNRYIFAIKAPMASGYVLTITRNDAPFKTITSNFVPNAEGLILPNADLELDLFAAGTYRATVKGFNPKGFGEESEEAVREVGWEIAEKLEWPAEGFIPTAGRNIVVPQGAKEFTVKFSWPVVSAAAAYNFHLYDSFGKVVKVMQDVRNNAMDVRLAIGANAFGSYTWWVEAVRGNDVLASTTMSFRLVKQTAAPLVDGFVIAVDGGNRLIMSFSPEQGALPAVGTISYEVQHYDASAKRWIMYLKKDGKAVRPVDLGGGAWSLNLPDSTFAVGDYILVREYVNNVVQGNFVLYRLNYLAD